MISKTREHSVDGPGRGRQRPSQQRKVLVTGGTGFLGAAVAQALTRLGHRVLILSRHAPDLRGVEHLAADISDKAGVTKAVRHCDAIVHCAGLVSLQPRSRAELLRVNVEGTRNVLEAALKENVRVVHTSSIATLGYTASPLPQTEGATLRPEDRANYPYAESKWLAERVVTELTDAGGDIVTVNPGYLLGPGDAKLTTTKIVLQYLRGGVWFFPPGGISFADVRDVAGAIANAVSGGKAGDRYALGGENLSYRELFEALYRLTGVRRPLPAPRAAGLVGALTAQLAAVFVPHPFQDFNLLSWRFACRFNYCDSSKAERGLGYARRSFDETLRDTVADQLARGLVEPSTPQLLALALHGGQHVSKAKPTPAKAKAAGETRRERRPRGSARAR